MLIKLIRSFSSAHHLPGYNGQCRQLHGHTWKAVFIIEGPIQPSGMVCDFKVVKKLLDDNLPDHRLLNDILPNPTAELLADHLFKHLGAELKKLDLTLKTLEIWESDNAAAIAQN